MIAPHAVRQSNIAVPQAYKDHLRVNERRTLIATSLALALSYAYGFLVPHHHTSYVVPPSIIPPLFMVTQWLKWAVGNSAIWDYEMNRRGVKLLAVAGNGWFHQWYKLQPGKHVIMEMRQEIWRGLPALRLIARTKWPLSQQTLLMVYSEEDRHIVETQWLPYLEQYRQPQQGHSANRLSS